MARALGGFGSAGVDPLVALTRADDPEVRRQAVETLGFMTDKGSDSLKGGDARRAATAVASALTDKDPQVRIFAFNWLGHLGPAQPEAVGDLIKALNDDTPGVPAAAVKCLGAMGPVAKDSIPTLKEMLYKQRGVADYDIIEALGKIGPPAVPVLVPLLDTFCDSCAAKALVRIGRPALPRCSAYSMRRRSTANIFPV